MEELTFVFVKSAFEFVDTLNERIYNEAERDGYHNLVTETQDGITQSVTIFKNLKNIEHIKMIIDGYEFLNDSAIQFGKVKTIEKYLAKEYSNSPVRLKVMTEFDELFDLPVDAIEHLGLDYNYIK
jgi:hypothetical protein